LRTTGQASCSPAFAHRRLRCRRARCQLKRAARTVKLAEAPPSHARRANRPRGWRSASQSKPRHSASGSDPLPLQQHHRALAQTAGGLCNDCTNHVRPCAKPDLATASAGNRASAEMGHPWPHRTSTGQLRRWARADATRRLSGPTPDRWAMDKPRRPPVNRGLAPSSPAPARPGVRWLPIKPAGGIESRFERTGRYSCGKNDSSLTNHGLRVKVAGQQHPGCPGGGARASEDRLECRAAGAIHTEQQLGSATAKRPAGIGPGPAHRPLGLQGSARSTDMFG